MTVLAECLTEFQAALASLEPELTGLHDQRLLPNSPGTQDALDAQITLFQTRRSLLESAIAALATLQADGYPDVAMVSVAEEVYAEMQGNAEEVLAALEHFRQLVRLDVPQTVDAEVQSAVDHPGPA